MLLTRLSRPCPSRRSVTWLPGRPLTSEATHKRRYAGRLEVTMKVRNIKEFGDGSPKDQLEKLVALTEKME